MGAITHWLDEATAIAGSPDAPTLLQLGWALRSFANNDYRAAATLLDESVPRVSRLGGSRAQNELFGGIGEEAARRGDVAVAA